MPLEPGPFVPLELALPSSTSDPQEFSRLTMEMQGELDEIDQELGRFEETVFSLPLEAPTTDLDQSLEVVAVGVGDLLRSPDELADAEVAAPEIEQHIIDSTTAVPAEAFIQPQEFPEFIEPPPPPTEPFPGLEPLPEP